MLSCQGAPCASQSQAGDKELAVWAHDFRILLYPMHALCMSVSLYDVRLCLGSVQQSNTQVVNSGGSGGKGKSHPLLGK